MAVASITIENTRRQVIRRAMLFALAVVAAVAWVLHTAYLQTRLGAEDRLRSLAQVIAKGIEGSFRESDYVLRDVIGHIDPGNIRFPDPDSRRKERVRRLLQEKAQTQPNIYGISIMSTDCIVAYAAREEPGFNLGKRPYCQAMRGQNDMDSYISGVYPGQQNFLQLTMARKIRNSDGRFAGAALLRMETGFFESWLHNTDVGVRGSAALLDLDMNLVARRPAAQQALGKPVDDERLRRFIAENRLDTIHRLRSPVDKVDRIYIVRRVGGLPLVVVLGLATEEVFAEWQTQALWFVIGALTLLAVSAVATRHYLKIVQQGDALGWRSQAIDANSDAVTITDDQGVIEYVNPAFTAQTGYTAQEAIGSTPRVLKSGRQDDLFYRRMWTTILAGAPWRGELVNRCKDGSLYCDLMTISPVKNAEGRVVRFIAIHHDITQRKRMEEDLAELAHFDRLTGLPNRALFFDRVERAITEARREQNGFTVLYLDLDGFKAVNDQHGHETGDALLREVAKRLGSCVRESDTVGRIGGDEFAVLLRTVNRLEGAAAVAQKIIEALATPVALEGYTCRVGASVGIGLHPDDGVNVEALLRNADFAMYEAKRRGKNCWVYAGDLI
ncbi:MAG: diguanylate cyclase [Sulfuritalea sp.]|nr:diguanylate cyclase [Sulfuritalea sp.]